MVAIGAVGPISMPAVNTSLTSGAGASATGGTSFADMLSSGLSSVQQSQASADQLGTQAATGQLTDVADYMIASTQASVATELTVTLRNKAVDAFNEIMRMQA